MQFGRLHGIALLVFGVFLLLAQAWISLGSHSTTPAQPAPPTTAPSSADRESVIHLLPGLLGAICVAGGFIFYVREKDKPADVPVHPIR